MMHEIDNLSECLLGWKTLAKQHYKELERLKAENKVLWDEREEPHQRIALYISECNRLEAERDALRAELDALKGDENVGLDRQEPNKSNLAEFDLDGAFLSANVRKPLEQALLNAPKPTIELVGVDEYGPRLNWYTHWANFSDGQKFYTRPIPPAPSVQAVAGYLDLGVGGYIDIETALTDDELAALPKGRHALAIVGTYGVDGFAPASTISPAPSVPEGWQLVPIEPTEDMQHAWIGHKLFATAYRKMLAAAPKPEVKG